MRKPCKWCLSTQHTRSQCFKKPKKPIVAKVMKRTTLRKMGKVGKQWIVTKMEWFGENPPDENGFYYCYIPWCDKKLVLNVKEYEYSDINVEEVTLDHKESRTRRPDLRFVLSNLFPCCHFHNKQKGSISYEEFIDTLAPEWWKSLHPQE